MANGSSQGSFEVVFVKEMRLLEEVKYLRGKVFFGHDKKDEDEFDGFCEHLVVRDAHNKAVIGTYRLLLGSTAKKHIGFYSETEFDLTNIKKNCRGELLEMSRACVSPAYRKYPIINLLWKELLCYFAKHKVSYIFGCPSIERPHPQIVGKLFKFFKDKHFAPSQYEVFPLKDKVYNFTRDISSYSQKEIVKVLPSLMRGYLKMGALVCSGPAWDKKFDTADFFMMLDIKNININYKNRFYNESD